MRNHLQKNNNAFTLVELLVVISIIAILLVIVVPSLARARAQAKAVICKTQFKNMYVFTMLYTEDYDDWLPSAERTPLLGGYWGFRAAKGYRCRSDRRGLPEMFGINALFDHLKYVDFDSDIWICPDPGMNREYIKEYGSTVAFSVAGILSKYKYSNLIGKHPHSWLLWDNIEIAEPSPVCWVVEKDADSKPTSYIDAEDQRQPHWHLARKQTNKYGQEFIDKDARMVLTIDGWIGTGGQNEDRMDIK